MSNLAIYFLGALLGGGLTAALLVVIELAGKVRGVTKRTDREDINQLMRTVFDLEEQLHDLTHDAAELRARFKLAFQPAAPEISNDRKFVRQFSEVLLDPRNGRFEIGHGLRGPQSEWNSDRLPEGGDV